MFCVYCQRHVVECLCPDIEERLAGLLRSETNQIAAAQALAVRKVERIDLRAKTKTLEM